MATCQRLEKVYIVLGRVFRSNSGMMRLQLCHISVYLSLIKFRSHSDGTVIWLRHHVLANHRYQFRDSPGRGPVWSGYPAVAASGVQTVWGLQKSTATCSKFRFWFCAFIFIVVVVESERRSRRWQLSDGECSGVGRQSQLALRRWAVSKLMMKYNYTVLLEGLPLMHSLSHSFLCFFSLEDIKTIWKKNVFLIRGIHYSVLSIMIHFPFPLILLLFMYLLSSFVFSGSTS